MLDSYRVLDLTDARGWLAGFLLAQLGADVIAVEPPGGWERDLVHEAYNRGKRSVALGDAEDLVALATYADVVLDCGALPFEVDLGRLRDANPSLITVSMSPFGATGPKAGWLATDITLFAASGQMAVTGDPDRPPVRTSVPQAWLHASSEAAVASLVALHDRAASGLGQHVDLSAQQAVFQTNLPTGYEAPAGLPVARRESGGVSFGPVKLRFVFPAKDGHVSLSYSFGPMIGPYTRRLHEWIDEEGFGESWVLDVDFVDLPLQLQSGERSWDELTALLDLVEEFTSTKTKAELLEEALSRGLLIAPISTLADVMDSPQLAARDYWDEVDGVRHPGPMVKASATPLPRLGQAPPVGCDTDEVMAEFSDPGLIRIPSVADAPPERPLAGLKVADFSWVAAAPLATRVLAYWGAEVVRVESSRRPCLARVALGFRDDIADQENDITWHAVNAGKMGLALDLTVPEARDTALDLVRWSDVVVESFTPGTMASMGLGYDDLTAVKPDLVMLSSCVMGQDGPLSAFAGFGNLAAAVAGFFDVTGWPDRPPAGPYLAYTDYTSPRFTVCALLAAVDHHRRTGQGQYLDFSQMEAATHFLTPALLEYQRSGHLPTRRGNDDAQQAPHGVYPGMVPQSWIAIACETDEQWASLAIEMRRRDLADLPVDERHARRDELDELIGVWTARQDPAGLQHRLQAHGVPAHHVQNSGQCLNDPQLQHRGHYVWLPHPEARRAMVETMPYSMSRSVGGYGWAGPTYGQHAMEVLGDLLGYDPDRIAELAVADALV